MMVITPHPAVAGPFADDMAKCLVKSTSDADRADLVRWIYSAMSLHPDLASMANISDKERDELNAKAGKLFSRLLFESCRTEFVQALKNEGPTTIRYAFQILGQVATRGMMTDTHVTQSMAGLGKSIDEAKLKELVEEAGRKQGALEMETD
jgi:hypothetical protein